MRAYLKVGDRHRLFYICTVPSMKKGDAVADIGEIAEDPTERSTP